MRSGIDLGFISVICRVHPIWCLLGCVPSSLSMDASGIDIQDVGSRRRRPPEKNFGMKNLLATLHGTPACAKNFEEADGVYALFGSARRKNHLD